MAQVSLDMEVLGFRAALYSFVITQMPGKYSLQSMDTILLMPPIWMLGSAGVRRL